MSEGKFTIESDFVDSFLNYIILNKSKVSDDAHVFAQCVNLNKAASTIADCSGKRDRIANYLENNEKAQKTREEVLSNCSSQLLKAHIPYYLLNQQNVSVTDRLFLKDAFNEGVSQLKKCYSNH
jgi:hypothetical protein